MYNIYNYNFYEYYTFFTITKNYKYIYIYINVSVPENESTATYFVPSKRNRLTSHHHEITTHGLVYEFDNIYDGLTSTLTPSTVESVESHANVVNRPESLNGKYCVISRGLTVYILTPRL